MNRELETVEHGPVDLERAIAILLDVYQGRKDFYDSGEEALAATTVGFSRAESDFIQLCVHGPSDVAVTFELPIRQKSGWFSQSVFQMELTGQSFEEADRWVRQYFTLDHGTLAALLESRAAG